VGRDPVVKREGGEISEIQFPLVTTEYQEGVRNLTWYINTECCSKFV